MTTDLNCAIVPMLPQRFGKLILNYFLAFICTQKLYPHKSSISSKYIQKMKIFSLQGNVCRKSKVVFSIILKNITLQGSHTCALCNRQVQNELAKPLWQQWNNSTIQICCHLNKVASTESCSWIVIMTKFFKIDK